MIFIGPLGAQFKLFKLSQWQIDECENFAVIGSGAQAAEPILYQRELGNRADIPRATYAVWEAKKLSQGAPGVGKETSVILMRIGECERLSVSHGKQEILEQQFRTLGPKRYLAGLDRTADIFPDVKTTAFDTRKE